MIIGDGGSGWLEGCANDPESGIMVTAIHDISTRWKPSAAAYDYILKPFEKDQLFLGVGRAQHRRLIIETAFQRNWSSSSSCAPRSYTQSTWNLNSPTTIRSKPSEARWT